MHLKIEIRRFVAALFVLLFFAVTATAAEKGPVKPSAEEKCPVCGMFVAKYPDWTAQVRFTDEKTVFFDGAKDLFKFYFDIGHYQPKRSAADVGAVYVTDYYTLEPIRARDAFFVVGSNVYGPMGRELIAFAAEEQAREFMRDHRGRKILRFDAVSPEIVRSLD